LQHANGPPAGAFQRSRHVPAPSGVPAAQGIGGQLVVLRLAGPVALEIEAGLRLADVLRAAARSRAQEALGAVPEVLSGHGGHGEPLRAPHVAPACAGAATRSAPGGPPPTSGCAPPREGQRAAVPHPQSMRRCRDRVGTAAPEGA